MHTFVNPNEHTKGEDKIQSYEVEPPATWEEILEFGNPAWFRYETPLGAFAYFPKDAEQYGIASSSRNTEVWVGLIRDTSLADIPEHDLSRLLADLTNGLVVTEPNLGHYLQYKSCGVIIQ